MSKVVKGVKKIFKKVVKVVKKIAVPLLVAGAILFTGGAALGLAPMAGGWAGAASAVTSAFGATGTLGSIMTGAITQAGYSAVVGGVVSSASGGSFSDGAKAGAAIGAVTGGIGGFASSRAAAAAPGQQVASNIASPGGGSQALKNMLGKDVATAAAAPPAGVVASSVPGTAVTQGKGLLSGIGSFVKNNEAIVGSVVHGVGQGLLSGAEQDADLELLREKQKLRNANYEGADPGANYRVAAEGASGQTPTERFDPSIYGSWEYKYNPKSGRIERAPRDG